MEHNTCSGMDAGSREEKLFSVDSLMAALHQIRDPRRARGVRYGLVDLLVLLILAKLGGEDSLKGMAEWIRLRRAVLVELLNLERDSLPIKPPTNGFWVGWTAGRERTDRHRRCHVYPAPSV